MDEIIEKNTCSNAQGMLVFTVGEKSGALPLQTVERVFRAVELVILPDMSEKIEGLLNLNGDALPVISLRNKFGMPMKEIELSDFLIIVNYCGGRFVIRSETTPQIKYVNINYKDSPNNYEIYDKLLDDVANIEGKLIPIFNPAALLTQIKLESFSELN
jgi:purine-binding chemotaxis protein CheW